MRFSLSLRFNRILKIIFFENKRLIFIKRKNSVRTILEIGKFWLTNIQEIIQEER